MFSRFDEKANTDSCQASSILPCVCLPLSEPASKGDISCTVYFAELSGTVNHSAFEQDSLDQLYLSIILASLSIRSHVAVAENDSICRPLGIHTKCESSCQSSQYSTEQQSACPRRSWNPRHVVRRRQETVSDHDANLLRQRQASHWTCLHVDG